MNKIQRVFAGNIDNVVDLNVFLVFRDRREIRADARSRDPATITTEDYCVI